MESTTRKEREEEGMNSFEEVFDAAKEYCVRVGEIGEIARGMWLDTLEPGRLEGSDAVVYCGSNFQKDILEKQSYYRLLREGFEEILGFPVNLRIVVRAEEEEKLPETDEAEIEQIEEESEGPEYEHTFDTFIVGSSNEFAYAACTSVARGNGTDMTYNPLFIYGPSGLGKTHLLLAISHEMKKLRPGLNILYVTGETFTNELIESIYEKKDTPNTKFHEKYRGVDVLLMDDVQFISGKEATQEEFFHTFDSLQKLGKQIVLTSDRPPKDIQILEDRIRTRFESGLIADISLPDFETRVAIVQRKAELLGLRLPEDVAEFIATKLKTNIRQLEGAVKKLKALKTLANSQPSLSMAQTVIREILTDEQPVSVTVERIVDEVARLYGVTPQDIRSKKRSQVISTARKVAIYLVHEITQMTLTAIGEEFGGRDHSTVVYALKDVEQSIQTDPSTREAVETITKSVRSSSK